MAEKQIVWSKRARLQLTDVLEFYYLRNGNSKYSLKLLYEVEKLVAVLAKSELIGRLTVNKSTRVIALKVYLVFYEIKEEQIEIVAFWDNRQNVDSRKIE
jgi:plasmid stabilization system protein ParE